MQPRLSSLAPSLSPSLPIEAVTQNLIKRKTACKVQLQYIAHVSKHQSRGKQAGSKLLASKWFCCD